MRSASRWKRLASCAIWFRNGGRKHQRAPLVGSGGKDEFEIVAEAEVEHLVGLVENDRSQRSHIERTARDVIAQAAGRSNDDMRAFAKRTALGAHIHTADAGSEPGAGFAEKPFQFAANLHGEFARRRNNEGEWRGGWREAFRAIEKRGRNRDTEGDRLAGTGLGRDQQVGVLVTSLKHGMLHRSERLVATGFQRRRQRSRHRVKVSHGNTFVAGADKRPISSKPPRNCIIRRFLMRGSATGKRLRAVGEICARKSRAQAAQRALSVARIFW